MAERLRTVIWHQEFEQDFARLRRRARRVEDFVESSEWALARDPYRGVQIPRTQTWVLTSRTLAYRLPPVTLYYTFDDNEVHFLAIEFATISQ